MKHGKKKEKKKRKGKEKEKKIKEKRKEKKRKRIRKLTGNYDQRRGEWMPQISFETFDRCPKSTLKRHTDKSYKNMSHQELRDPKDIP
jgi:hypothetical protein